MRISFIIPTLNEDPRDRVLIKPIRETDAEIIVADGGSHDRTAC